MKTSFLLLLVAVAGLKVTLAFMASFSNNARELPVDSTATATTGTVLGMIGGRGWDNNDFLSSLSGDDEDRSKSEEDYKDFSDRRAAFNARQEEIMKTPQGKAFMKQREEQQFQHLEQQQQQQQISEDGNLFENISEGSGGGTRMGKMMAQAKLMQGRRSQSNMIGGFNQQLLGPLDDEDSGNEEM